MLAVVDEEVGLGALRQRVLARVRVGRPLGHLPPRSLARLLRSAANRSGVRAWGVGGLSGTAARAEAIEQGICVVGEETRGEMT